MSCSDVAGVPCARSTRMAYIRLELDDINVVTWSTAVSLSFTVTPRIRRLDTRSTPGRGGGGSRFRLAVKIIFPYQVDKSATSWQLPGLRGSYGVSV